MRIGPFAFQTLLGLTLAMPAHAGAYLGAGVGISDYNDSLWSVEDGVNETGWTVFAGYQFNRYLALETAWVDLGTVNAGNASLETKGLSVQGIGSIPVGPAFSLFGKVGTFTWDQDARIGTARDSNSGTDLAWGYGFAARFFENRLGLRVGWERYESDNDADFISLGASYHY